MKNIIVCSDGTGNSAIKGRGTNVFKLFEAIDLNGHRYDPKLPVQVALYDDGVGTQSFKVFKILAGATGWGLSRNVKQLYKEIVRIYDPGDKIFLFGFSRGAFTVRTLADLIHTCGILDAKRFTTAGALKKAVAGAYRLYRENYRTGLAKIFLGKPDGSRIAQLRKDNCCPDQVEISFLGVWDTVDGVGLPFHLSDIINLTLYRFKFPDLKLGACVKRACHALAVDDERHSFHPLLWENDPGKDDSRIEQVWFAGAHSNVGGGYPKQGMSLVTLDWMMSKAEEEGLSVVGSDRALYRDHATVDDTLYNPRAGLGVFYRWKPRNISKMCAACHIAPQVHLSALERIAHGTDDYAPGNLPPNAKVVFTPISKNDPAAQAKNDALRLRAKEVEGVLRAAHRHEDPNQDGTALMMRARGAVVTGMVSYYLFLLTTVATLLAASAPAGGWTFMKHLKNVGAVLGSLMSLQWSEVGSTLKGLLGSPGLLWLFGSGYLLSLILAVIADQRRSNKFSQFWHNQQPALRDALKHARDMVQTSPALWDERGTIPAVPLPLLGGQDGSPGEVSPLVLLPDGDGRGVQPGSAGTPPKL